MNINNCQTKENMKKEEILALFKSWSFLVYGRLSTTPILTPSNSKGLERRQD
jgi:hypothetical protein